MKKQINNGFLDIYWIDDKTAEVFKKNKNEFKKLNVYKNRYSLKTLSGDFKSVSVKKLYKLVFEKEFYKDEIEDLKGEVWKEIKDSKGKYFVSNKGRIKSFKRKQVKILKSKNKHSKYDRVDLSINGSIKTYIVYRLVAEYFLPQPQSINFIIRHLDGNIHNNCATNLQIVERL